MDAVSHSRTDSPVSVLLVEDNPLDARMFGTAAERSDFPGTIHTVDTGEDAIEFLSLPSNHRIELLLLDLNLPGIDGFDVLERLKADEAMQSVPVIVFSSSANQLDINRAYECGAAAYLPKPVGLEGYRAAVESIMRFWNSVAYAQ